MNVVKEIERINNEELKLGVSGASWHDDYKDSAYIYVGGLHLELTEGDVITIFSQYGEVVDINLPRDKETGKQRGFGFLMYEDQRSTVLAVDNLNGAKVLDRTLRVDHVRDYKQPGSKDADGKWVEAEEQSMNAKPQMIIENDVDSDSSEATDAGIDPEDPMRDYLLEQRREEKARQKSKKSKKSKGKHKDETPEERAARKAKKKQKKEKKEKKSAGMRGVEDLLKSLRGAGGLEPSHQRSKTPERDRHHRLGSHDDSPSPRHRAERSRERHSKRREDETRHRKHFEDDDRERSYEHRHSRSRDYR